MGGAMEVLARAVLDHLPAQLNFRRDQVTQATTQTSATNAFERLCLPHVIRKIPGSPDILQARV